MNFFSAKPVIIRVLSTSPAGNLQNSLFAVLFSFSRAYFLVLVFFVDQAGVGFTQLVELIE